MENGNRKRKNSGAGAWAIGLILLISALRGISDSETLGRAVGLVVLAAVVAAVTFGAVRKARAARGRSAGSPGRAPARAAVQRTEPWNRSETKRADPWTRGAAVRNHAVRTESPADGSLTDTARDRQRRRDQLDAFLANGLVDRKEYELLLRKHEQIR